MGVSVTTKAKGYLTSGEPLPCELVALLPDVLPVTAWWHAIVPVSVPICAMVSSGSPIVVIVITAQKMPLDLSKRAFLFELVSRFFTLGQGPALAWPVAAACGQLCALPISPSSAFRRVQSGLMAAKFTSEITRQERERRAEVQSCI